MYKKALLFIVLFFAACSSPAPTATLSRAPSQTPASTAPASATPAPSSTPSPVPTLTSTPVPTAILPPTPAPISAQNANQLVPLQQVQAQVNGFKWFPIVSFASDFKRYTTSLDAKSLTLWEAGSSQPITTLTGISEIFPVVFAPDGKTLASGDDKGNVIIWDAATGQQLHVISGFSRGLTALVFSPDSKIIAATSYMVTYDETLVLLDAANGKYLRSISCIAACWVAAFSPDGKTLATNSLAGQKDKIVLRDTATGKKIGSPLVGLPYPIYSLAFSPDGKILAAGDRLNTTVLWDTGTGQQLAMFDPISRKSGLSTWEQGLYALAFSPDGRTLAAGYASGSVILWDVATTQPLFFYKGTATVAVSGLVVSLAFSADGRQLAVADKGNTGTIWGISSQPVPTPTLTPTTSAGLSTLIDTTGSLPEIDFLVRSAKDIVYPLHDAGTYTIQLETNDNTNLCWLAWILYPKSNQTGPIATTSDSNIPATFTIPKAGDYILAVREVFYTTHCQAFSYTLKVTRP